MLNTQQQSDTIDNIIISMKSSLQNSFYMGISYRPTHRPSPAHPLSTFSYQKSTETSQKQVIEEQKIIHKCKNHKRVKQILRHYNPYIVRKQCELKNKKKKKQKNQQIVDQIEEGKDQFFRITKLEKFKTEGNQKFNQNLDQGKFQGVSVSVTLPQKDRKKYFNKTHQYSKTSELNVQSYTQTQPIFSHFPSQLFVGPSKSRKSQQIKNSVALKLNNFFFPSRRVKTQVVDNSNRSQSKKIRPTSSHPRKKFSHDTTRVFNFDGTLQNHKISIPQRPKTADHRFLNRQSEKRKDAQYLTFEQIAKRCVRLKSQKKNDNDRIQPWLDENQNKISIDLFQVSCSSIRCDNSLQL